MRYCIPFNQIRNADVARVGGKNASLGEMVSELAPFGVQVPTGFAITAEAYRFFFTGKPPRRAPEKSIEFSGC